MLTKEEVSDFDLNEVLEWGSPCWHILIFGELRSGVRPFWRMAMHWERRQYTCVSHGPFPVVHTVSTLQRSSGHPEPFPPWRPLSPLRPSFHHGGGWDRNLPIRSSTFPQSNSRQGREENVSELSSLDSKCSIPGYPSPHHHPHPLPWLLSLTVSEHKRTAVHVFLREPSAYDTSITIIFYHPLLRSRFYVSFTLPDKLISCNLKCFFGLCQTQFKCSVRAAVLNNAWWPRTAP